MRIRAYLVGFFACAVAMLGFSATPAPGTVLCQLNETSCSLESTLPSETTVSGSLQSGTSTTFGPATCKQSTIKAKTLSKEAEKLPLTISELTFGECTLSGATCTLTAAHLPYEGSLQYGETGNGSLPFGAGKEGSPSGSINCSSLGLKCAYTIEAKLDVTGGAPAKLTASAEPIKRTEGGFLCPTESSWSATYTVSAPEVVFLAQQAKATNTVLCKAKPTGTPLVCPAAEVYSGQVTGSLPAGIPATFSKPGGTEVISCSKATLEGSFKTDGTSAVKGGITKLQYETAGGTCTSTLGGKPNVKVEGKNLDFDRSTFLYISEKPANGSFVMAKNNLSAPELLIEIVEKVNTTCRYQPDLQTNTLTNANGAASLLLLSTSWAIKPNEPKNCPTPLTQEAYTDIRIAGNTPLYIAEKTA